MRINNLYLGLIALLILLSSCTDKREIEGSFELRKNTISKKVKATVETEHKDYDPNDDSIDDPAIWINKNNYEKSVIFGTDKINGVGLYNLEGKMINFYELGACNNIDVRYDFVLGTDTIDIIGFTNRSTNSIDLYTMNNKNDGIEFIGKQVLGHDFGKIYGFCLYHNIDENKYYAFANTKEGVIEQWLFEPKTNNEIAFTKVKRFTKNGTVEGMVADDVVNLIYIGEENYGIWRHNASEDSKDLNGELLLTSVIDSNINITADIEGLAIYKASNGEGYLIASSQGNFSYSIFERKAPNKYIGSFYIEDGEIDGAEETDGIEVCNLPLNNTFSKGIFIVQDGLNYNKETAISQNFKYIKWEDIASQFSPPLTIDIRNNK